MGNAPDTVNVALQYNTSASAFDIFVPEPEPIGTLGTISTISCTARSASAAKAGSSNTTGPKESSVVVELGLEFEADEARDTRKRTSRIQAALDSSGVDGEVINGTACWSLLIVGKSAVSAGSMPFTPLVEWGGGVEGGSLKGGGLAAFSVRPSMDSSTPVIIPACWFMSKSLKGR